MLTMIKSWVLWIWTWIAIAISTLPWKEILGVAATLFILYVAYEFFFGDDGIL